MTVWINFLYIFSSCSPNCFAPKDEHTPAFEPFKTATGKRLKRWANHVLETEYNSKPRVEGYNTNSLKIGNNPEDDLEDGKIFSVMHRSCPQLVMHATKKVHDALQIADAVGKLTNKPPLVKSVPTSHAKVPTVTQLLEMNAVKRYVPLDVVVSFQTIVVHRTLNFLLHFFNTQIKNNYQ